MPLNCGVREDSWESLGQQGDQTSQYYRKSTLNIHWKEWCWSWSSNTMPTWLEELNHWKKKKKQMLGKTEDREKGTTENEMVGWHHWLNGHEFEQTPGDSKGQGSLACSSPWGCKESDRTEQLNKINMDKEILLMWLRLRTLKREIKLDYLSELNLIPWALKS